MAFESIQKLFCCHAASSEPKGHFGDHTAVPGGKPFTFVLMLLGLGGMGVGILGLGVHQGWWNSGALSQLTQVDAIAMMSAGFASGVVGIVWAISRMNHQTDHDHVGYQLTYPEQKLSDKLTENSFSYVLEKNGKTYAKAERTNQEAQIVARGLTLDMDVTDAGTWDTGRDMQYVQTSLLPSQIAKIRNAMFETISSEQVRQAGNDILDDPEFILDPEAYLRPYLQVESLHLDDNFKTQAVAFILKDRAAKHRF